MKIKYWFTERPQKSASTGISLSSSDNNKGKTTLNKYVIYLSHFDFLD